MIKFRHNNGYIIASKSVSQGMGDDGSEKWDDIGWCDISADPENYNTSSLNELCFILLSKHLARAYGTLKDAGVMFELLNKSDYNKVKDK